MTNLLDQYGQPFSAITFADKGNPEVMRKMVVELAMQTKQLTKKDIGTWRRAWQMAISVENPRRGPLYNIFSDVEIDGHLSGAISQVCDAVKQRGFKIVDRKTKKEKPELKELLEADWFKDFMQLVLDARNWGHSLIQLGDVVKTAGTIKLQNVEIVPREHVVPELGLILKEPNDEFKNGIPYRDGKISTWVIEAGAAKNLGLFLKAAPHAISKKNMLAFWDSFGELFGMPIRFAKTSGEPAERSRVEKMLAQMGAAAWGVFPLGTDIDIKETSRADAFEVYDRRVVRSNSEMSKIVLSQTMTIDDGSSLSQSLVHEKMFKQTVEANADAVRDVVNNKLLPRLSLLGFPFSESDLFQWEYALEYSPEQLAKVEEIVLNNYDVEPKYFIERYSIPVIGAKQKQQQGLVFNKDLDFFV
ncbi:MAG: DUF935 family protein [Bacteroidales bacterium]|nr:DUF935 family protein [Bacteroidales bacterium]